MNKYLLILISISILSCQFKSDSKKTKVVKEKKSASEIPNVDVALKFINGWVENCNKMKNAKDIIEWTNSNIYTTANFKYRLTKLIDDAYRNDPELGLDFDPIFDAQDYPEEGFKVEYLDNKTGYLIVVGKKMREFKVTMKLEKKENNWLVDGSGIINIPKEKQSTR